MKKAIITYAKNYWTKIKNDELSFTGILFLAALIMAASFGIILLINPNIFTQY